VELPESVLHYVVRTQESVILDDASGQNAFSADEYIRHNRVRSVLCLPLIKQTTLIGVLYLENNLVPRVFTPARSAVLKLLASQAAISLENAYLYTDLQQENGERRRAEDAWRRSEAYLAEAQIISHTGSFGWNVSSGAIYWSAETFRIFEFDPRPFLNSRESFNKRIRTTELSSNGHSIAHGSRGRILIWSIDC